MSEQSLEGNSYLLSLPWDPLIPALSALGSPEPDRRTVHSKGLGSLVQGLSWLLATFSCIPGTPALGGWGASMAGYVSILISAVAGQALYFLFLFWGWHFSLDSGSHEC